jgi:phage terminase large subunit
MTEIEIYPEVFNAVYIPYLGDMARTQIFYGGSASGKSVFLAQRCVYDIMSGGRNYLITRQVGRTIRGSVFTEINRVISEWGVSHLFQVNKSDMTITCVNDYQIIFAGLDDVEKLKSLAPQKGALTDVWIEECTEADQNSVKQLYKRQRGGDENIPKRLTMSFNPILQSHWIYTEYFSGIGWTETQTEYQSPELSILKTIYKDNRFLTSDDVKDLENETDKYYYNVYTLGLWGVLGNVIFTNWSVQDLSDMRAQFTNTRNGLDFGFSSDPAAYGKSHYDSMRKIIYIFEEVYERGLTNPQLAEAIKPFVGREQVVCDSAEPKSIQELRDHGINAYPAKKGRDSVNFGIQWLQQQTIIIDKSCVNTANEFMQYKWKEDRDGNSIRQPVGKNDHEIDQLRYAYEDDMESAVLESGDSPTVGYRG